MTLLGGVVYKENSMGPRMKPWESPYKSLLSSERVDSWKSYQRRKRQSDQPVISQIHEKEELFQGYSEVSCVVPNFLNPVYF